MACVLLLKRLTLRSVVASFFGAGSREGSVLIRPQSLVLFLFHLQFQINS